MKVNAQNRRSILTELIGKNPGISFRGLMRLTNMKNGVLSHHLRTLEKTDAIKTERLARQTRFYPRGFSDEESIITKALRRETPRDIISALRKTGAYGDEHLSFAQIVSQVSKSPSTVSLYLSRLIKDNVVATTLNLDHKKKYHLCNQPLIDKIIEEHKPGLSEKHVSGFEDIINSL